MNWWVRNAGNLQNAGRVSEDIKDDRYTTNTVKRSIVYSREDLVMAVSLLDSVNKQLRSIRILLSIIAGILLMLAIARHV